MLIAVIALTFSAPAAARDPTNDEQFMVELINRMRLNPASELAKLVNINTGGTPTWGSPKSTDVYVNSALNSFNVSAPTLVSQWNGLSPAQPLAWNGFLGDSSQTYSNLMITHNAQRHDLDEHESPCPTPEDPSRMCPDPTLRFEASGYIFDGGGFGGENLFAFSENIFHAHAAFAIDWGSGPNGIQNPAGHRDLLMHGQMREIGIAVVNDTVTTNSVGPKVITQHIAVDDATNPFLTGVVYDENGSDNFYTPGEGLGGIKIIATATNGQRYETVTFGSGGFSLEVPRNRTYSLVASGPGLGQITITGVTVGTSNVKRDFITQSPPIIGDANMDGLVNRGDVRIVAKRLGKATGALWGDGDFNFDGRVTLADLGLLQQHLSPPGSPGMSPAAIPEPSSLSLAAMALSLGGFAARRRRRTG